MGPFFLAGMFSLVAKTAILLTCSQDMISSYAEIKHIPCIKCSQVTNNGAQLPTLRRPQLNQQFAEGEPRIYAFDVLHSGCA